MPRAQKPQHPPHTSSQPEIEATPHASPPTQTKSLWAEPVPYDPSCMDSTTSKHSLWAEPAPYDPSSSSDQTLILNACTPETPTQRQTPTHQRILGHINNYDNHHHPNLTDITLSPITCKNNHSPNHLNEPQSPIQHMNDALNNKTTPHLNDTRDNNIQTWIKKHTQHIINNF